MGWIIVFLIVVLLANAFANRIPRTGRAGITKGEEISSIITNDHKGGMGAKTMHLEGNGRKFKVKLKPDESHLWIKGDKVKVLVSYENKKIYRVLFFDYFHENEERLRLDALKMLEGKIKSNGVCVKILKFTEETYKKVEESSADSRTVFTLYSHMKLLDSYIAMGIVLAVFMLLAKIIARVSMTKMLLPIAVLGIVLWFTYNTITTCGRIIKKL